jgi:V/A-type H+-transporting ATPase subunit E
LKLDAARDALLADARDEAERLLAKAAEEADSQLESARREAEGLVAAARSRGEAEGRTAAARELAREHALARMEVLAARRSLYDELRRRAHDAVLKLREEPGYAELLHRLASVARRDLGSEAELEIDPEEVGGVRGRSGTRRVDYTLPALAERCVAGLGPSLIRLWE